MDEQETGGVFVTGMNLSDEQYKDVIKVMQKLKQDVLHPELLEIARKVAAGCTTCEQELIRMLRIGIFPNTMLCGHRSAKSPHQRHK